jgi:hypothetical protein
MFKFEPAFGESDRQHEVTDWSQAKDQFLEHQTYEGAERYILTTLSLLKGNLIGNDEYRTMIRRVGKFIDAFGVYTP